MNDDDLNADLLFRFWRIRKNAMQMCFDRGFDAPEHERNLTLDAFRDQFGDRPLEDNPSRLALKFILNHREDESKKIGVFFHGGKGGVSVIREITEEMNQGGIGHAVVVVEKPFTSAANKAIKECIAAGNRMQVFEETELVVNITQHELVPQHILQTEDEKAELLDRYKLKEQQLPRIKMLDPVAKYFGLARGQVVKIIRNNSPTAGRYVTYRIVY